MITALCLSGGGARGAFQVGVLRAMQQLGIVPDVGIGISTGALNIGHAMTARVDELTEVWRDVAPKDIHKEYEGFSLGWRIAVDRKRGVNDNRPLLDLIKRHLPWEPPENTYVGWVDMTTGGYLRGPATHDNVFASATMPIVWAPVGGRYVDGGLRHQTAIKDAAELGADRIIAVLTRPAGLANQEWRPHGRVLLIEDILRTLEILADENAEGDFREARRVNQLQDAGIATRSRSGRKHRRIEIIQVRPERWIGDTLSFDQTEIRDAIAHGVQRGIAVLGGLAAAA